MAGSRRQNGDTHEQSDVVPQIFGVTKPGDVHARIIRGGVPSSALRQMRTWLAVSQTDFAEILSTTERTLQRRESAETPMPANEADFVYRIARIADLATAMIGSADKARRWLRRANTALGGSTPLQMLRSEIGTGEVERALNTIAFGGVA